MDTTIYELDKCECVSSVIKIDLCKTLKYTQHTFVYGSYLTKTGSNAYQGAIIDNIRYAPICVLEEKDITTISKLKIMLRNFFEGTCSVKYAFKINSRDSY